MRLAAIQAWLGKTAVHAVASQRVLATIAGTIDPSVVDYAARGFCLLPSSEPQLFNAALTLARRTVTLGKKRKDLSHLQLALGMAELRSANYPAAEEALIAAEHGSKEDRHVVDASRFFHCMSLFHQSRTEESRILFAKAAAQMNPSWSRPTAKCHKPIYSPALR